MNPVDEGLVASADCWKNSSFNYYADDIEYFGGVELTDLFNG